MLPQPPLPPMRVLLALDDRQAACVLAEALQRLAPPWRVEPAADAVAAWCALGSLSHTAVVVEHGGRDVDAAQPLFERLPATARPHWISLCQPRELPQLLQEGGPPAHSYVLKPAQAGELAARLQALQRGEPGNLRACCAAGEVVLDAASRLAVRADRVAALTTRECELLQLLIAHAGQVLTRECIEQHIYRWGQDIGSNAIDVHVRALRRKLGPTLIETVRGQGYGLGMA